jgi:hypothetical protein
VAPAQTWKASQPEIDIHRLVLIDETGASTKMARLYGRSPSAIAVALAAFTTQECLNFFTAAGYDRS